MIPPTRKRGAILFEDDAPLTAAAPRVDAPASTPRGPARPVVFDLGDAPAAAPDLAEAVPDLSPDDGPVRPPALAQAMAGMAGGGRSRLGAWALGVAGALLSLMLSLAAWDFTMRLLARVPVLGAIAAGLLGVLVVLLLAMALREWRAYRRLARLDHIQRDAADALLKGDLGVARETGAAVAALYTGRPEAAWGLAHVRDRAEEQFDADGILGLYETALLHPLDKIAVQEVAAAARQVASVTALVPLAFADVAAALAANLRMIRRIAEIYGGRAGTIGAWRLTKTVMAHLVATGAVAVGDDLVGSVAGGSLLSKLSRRFGEGVVNGALTARVGVAAMEVCRPLPFRKIERPSVPALLGQALKGLFSS